MTKVLPTRAELEQRITALTMTIRCCDHLTADLATIERDELLEQWATLTRLLGQG